MNWLLLAVVVFYAPKGFGEGNDQPFLDGIAAYRSKDYKKAQELFSGLTQENPDNPALLYNWGLAEYHLGRMGLALGLWRKARTLGTQSIPIEQAIAFTEDQLFPNQNDKTFIVTIYETLLRMPLWLWWFFSLVSFTTAGWWSLEYGVKKRLTPNLWPSWLYFVFPLFVFTTIFATLDYFDHYKVSATIIEKDLPTRVGPTESSPALSQLSEGQLVQVEKYHEGWIQIRTKTGAPGWIPRNSAIEFRGR